jgi:hypothetical protein
MEAARLTVVAPDGRSVASARQTAEPALRGWDSSGALDFRGLFWRGVSRDRLTRQFLTESPPSDQEALRRAAHGAMRRI